ncbi:RusA family crossover junction endodeoxyribonuclease [Methylobacterium oxalidis]|uniref:Uncharacterized protein n=1 Tax=Methylobacterium oxalidis TaxID=944322 RepID=A0A512JA47_9HYPH|nr:RusA family crossover junction endodeoxyribonuclease [Methylobacterium oxalidis]GEP06844.1 hypothetical protein MOX02_48820 [Methylobacterium oxalidis]GJE35021.1 hypothetical protein LDDCCGHA_5238 [Methylobacterium oxalidis]GLS67562.1 hypothetical protein GCM10007888_59460 [Methylobacterium oxalidis]
MFEQIVIRLQGDPRGKGRHRSRVVALPGRAPFVQEYADPATARYERALAEEAHVEMAGRAMLTGPLVVTVYAFMPIPKSWPERKKREARNRVIVPVVKPDWDNIAKVCDALNGIVWGDDAAVLTGSVMKLYSDEPELVIAVQPWVPVLPVALLQAAE